jgi:hypothetical protein
MTDVLIASTAQTHLATKWKAAFNMPLNLPETS